MQKTITGKIIDIKENSARYGVLCKMLLPDSVLCPTKYGLRTAEGSRSENIIVNAVVRGIGNIYNKKEVKKQLVQVLWKNIKAVMLSRFADDTCYIHIMPKKQTHGKRQNN